LTFDHINNDGAKHRKLIPSTFQFIVWLKKHNWPKTIRLLCWNCNCSRQFWSKDD
jgi:hypothetical protein